MSFKIISSCLIFLTLLTGASYMNQILKELHLAPFPLRSPYSIKSNYSPTEHFLPREYVRIISYEQFIE